MKASLLSRIRSTDASSHAHAYTRFLVGGQVCGQVQSSLLSLLLGCVGPHGPVFERADNGLSLVQATHPTFEMRSSAMAAATSQLIDAALIKKTHGDLYPIAPAWNAPALCLIDRNAAPYFGVSSVGVHLHCYVRSPGDGGLQLWVAQRAADKSTHPGLWDPTVAGGQPSGLSLKQNVVKEAGEEAGLPPELAERATSTGMLSQMTAKADGSCLKQSLYFIWELEVPADWTPTPADGEVQRFERWDMARLEAEAREGSRFRPAMVALMADFLLRHGLLTPDAEPEYEELLLALHRPRLVL